MASAAFGLAMSAARAAPGCRAVVFFDADYGGESWEITGDQRYVGPHWNDQISSIRVLEGDWVFYRDAGYQGDVLRYGPGAYPTLPPQWNDQISSFQCVAGTGGPGPGYGGDDTYVYQGQSYAWYDDGWNGAGFYVIGLQYARGRGFGGREGDHGWHHHDHGRDHGGDHDRGGDHEHDRGHDHDHDHDHGHDRGHDHDHDRGHDGGDHGGRPHPGGGERPHPGGGERPHPGGGGRPHPGGGGRPHPGGGGHPHPGGGGRLHPGGGGHPHPGGGGHPHPGGGGHRGHR